MTNVEKLLSQITNENLLLLDAGDRESEFHLERLLAWQKDYRDYEPEWQKFYDNWEHCSSCNSYQKGGNCICYSRR